MSAGLAASTVTPGRTAPDESRTTPAIPLPRCCADAADGKMTAHAAAMTETPRTRGTNIDGLPPIAPDRVPSVRQAAGVSATTAGGACTRPAGRRSLARRAVGLSPNVRAALLGLGD